MIGRLDPVLRDAWNLGEQLGLISSVGLGALCGVYGLAFDLRPSLLATTSAVCLFWALFLADRIVERDPDGGHAAAFAKRNRRLTRTCLALALVLQLLICLHHPSWLLPIFGALLCSSAYFLPVPGLGRAAKDIPCLKSFYAATMILAICHLYVGPVWPTGAAQWAAVAAILCVEQASNALYDLKDLDSDRRQGRTTLAMALGLRPFLVIEMAVVVVAGLAVLAWPSSASPALAFAMALHIGAVFVLFRRPFDRVMTVGLDGIYSVAMFLAILLF